MGKMLPCSFCGSAEVEPIVDKANGVVFWVGRCSKCHARGPHGLERHHAIQLWNERAGVGVLDEAETAVVNHLMEAYNDFVKLPVLHPQHQMEFMLAVHQAQRLVLARPAIRG